MEAQVPAQRGASGVLADRMAAALVHREPGWQLPRRSALARRYNVSMAEIDVAIGELSRRSLIRRLPDGQLYRASPAEYLIPVEGIGGLSTQLDPMGGEISCQARHVSQRDAPQDVAWALGAAGQGEVRIIRCVWAVGAEPVAISTAYVPGAAGGPVPDDLTSFQATLQTPPERLLPTLRRARDVQLLEEVEAKQFRCDPASVRLFDSRLHDLKRLGDPPDADQCLRQFAQSCQGSKAEVGFDEFVGVVSLEDNHSLILGAKLAP